MRLLGACLFVFRVVTGQPTVETVRNVAELTAAVIPRGETNYFDFVEKTDKVHVPGNQGGADRITLPDGKSAFVKLRNFGDSPKSATEALRYVRQAEEWADEGRGPRVLGVGIGPHPQNYGYRIHLITENVFAEKNEYGTLVVAGDGNALEKLSDYSVAARKWVRDRYVSDMETHPDGNFKNILFRVTELPPRGRPPRHGNYFREGGKIIEVLQIDGDGKSSSTAATLALLKTFMEPAEAEAFVADSRARSLANMEEQLGLRPRPK